MTTHATSLPLNATPLSVFARSFGTLARLITYVVSALLLWRSFHPGFYYLEWIVLPFILICIVFPLSFNLAANGNSIHTGRIRSSSSSF